MSNPLDDTVLMERSKAGDKEAYSILFERHTARIWRLAYMILHNQSSADDVTQETFMQGLVHISTWRGGSDPKSWFTTIALNLCRHSLRDKGSQAQPAEPAKLERGSHRGRRPATEPRSRAIRKEISRALVVALGYLTDTQREVFILHYVDELPYEEISEILQINVGAARALALRAREMMQEKLGWSWSNGA